MHWHHVEIRQGGCYFKQGIGLYQFKREQLRQKQDVVDNDNAAQYQEQISQYIEHTDLNPADIPDITDYCNPRPDIGDEYGKFHCGKRTHKLQGNRLYHQQIQIPVFYLGTEIGKIEHEKAAIYSGNNEKRAVEQQNLFRFQSVDRNACIISYPNVQKLGKQDNGFNDKVSKETALVFHLGDQVVFCEHL